MAFELIGFYPEFATSELMSRVIETSKTRIEVLENERKINDSKSNSR
jgi:hypothetical protein